jgi:phenylacetate-coenzyme A ligase PaaK-like adenylate-forming protein
MTVARLLPDIRRAGRESRPAAALRRQARLARLIAYARRHSAFYGKLYAGLPGEIPELRSLPPVAKRDLMSNFDGCATDPAVTRESAEAFVADPSRIGRLYLDRYVAFATSGTTGRPAVFLHDREAASVYLALLLARRLPSLIAAGSFRSFLWNRCRTATIVTTGGHFTSSVIEALVRSRYPVLSGRNRTFSLLAPIPELVRQLNGFQPAVIGSYPTALSVLAGEQAAGRLRIRPALALTGAERLSPAASERIAASFRCPLRDTYAASEFPGIAFDCRNGRLHLNEDWAILEPVDAAFRPVPPGEPSHTTLLTNLANRVFPIIRYDLGDSVTVVPTACPCGSPLPSIRPEGRRDEILRLASPGGEAIPLLPLVLATVVEGTPGIVNYQVIRIDPGRLRVRFDEAPGHDRLRLGNDLVRRLREHLSTRDLGSVAVELSEERPRREAGGGKIRQFYSGRDGP